MTPTQIAAIAAGLSEAERCAVITGRESDSSSLWFTLRAKSIVAQWPWSLTPLGLAVRARLQEQSHER